MSCPSISGCLHPKEYDSEATVSKFLASSSSEYETDEAFFAGREDEATSTEETQLLTAADFGFA